MGDGPMHQSGRQMVNFGNRGIASFSMTVYGPMQPLHDGHYGSWAPSPSVMIANLVASLRDDNGHILIPHFYDDVAPVSAADKAALAAMPPVEAQLKKALGLGRNIGPARLADGYLAPTLERARHPCGRRGAAAPPTPSPRGRSPRSTSAWRPAKRPRIHARCSRAISRSWAGSSCATIPISPRVSRIRRSSSSCGTKAAPSPPRRRSTCRHRQRRGGLHRPHGRLHADRDCPSSAPAPASPMSSGSSARRWSGVSHRQLRRQPARAERKPAAGQSVGRDRGLCGAGGGFEMVRGEGARPATAFWTIILMCWNRSLGKFEFVWFRSAEAGFMRLYYLCGRQGRNHFHPRTNC